MTKLIAIYGGIALLALAGIALTLDDETTAQVPDAKPAIIKKVTVRNCEPGMGPNRAPLIVLTEALDLNADGTIDEQDVERWDGDGPEVATLMAKLYRALKGFDEDAKVPSLKRIDKCYLPIRELGRLVTREAISHPDATGVLVLCWDWGNPDDSAIDPVRLSDEKLEQVRANPMPRRCGYRRRPNGSGWLQEPSCTSARYVY